METKRKTKRSAKSITAKVRLFENYMPQAGVFDEMYGADGSPRAEARNVISKIEALGLEEFSTRQHLADTTFRQGGITFSVYSDNRGVEKIFPFDTIPRVVASKDWQKLERGLEQRVKALNLFLADIYGEQKIVKDGVIPEAHIKTSKGFLPAMQGVKPLGGVYVHIAGIDLIRNPAGEFVVLEDNIRTPSGVSYVLENRKVMKRVFPRIFSDSRVRPVHEYPLRLREALLSVSPRGKKESRLVVLTPGPYNSAYFEHSFLARQMGVELVVGQDLFVHKDHVFVKTTNGPEPVDVIYRRVDDAFLDPEAFRKDSMLGVPGLIRAYSKGNVALANALGNGVADDKGIYPYVPDMIRYYLKQDPIVGQVETYICARDNDCQHVLANLSKMVVKAVDESGGYGMLMGYKSTKAEIEDFAERIKKNPRGYIAQPLIELSMCPTWTGAEVAGRRVDLRPYIVTGKNTWVLPGGLTRVALVEGSYVVNSSQGGGSKDTWVLE